MQRVWSGSPDTGKFTTARVTGRTLPRQATTERATFARVPTPNIRDLLERYTACVTAGDVGGIVALYAPEATAEIPVGGPVHRGIDAIHRFYTDNELAESLTLTGPVRVAGFEAAAPMQAIVVRDGTKLRVDVIDVVQVGEDGLLRSMRAYFDLEGASPL